MKQKLVSMISVLAYWSGVTHFFYWLNRDRKRIITFHNVLPEELFKRDLTNAVSDSEESLRAIIRELKKGFRFSTDLRDPKTLTVTFDDGYLNQYAIAGKVLQEEGVPAILFLAGELLDNHDPEKALTIDLLLHWTEHAPCGDYHLQLPTGETTFTLEAGDRRQIWREVLQPIYMADTTHRGRKLLRQLDAQYSLKTILTTLPEAYKKLRLTGISSHELDDLRERGWTIGWHTRSHSPLSSLPLSEQRDEITPPPGFKDAPFSYPYGWEGAVGEEAIQLAQACGYPCAVSNTLESKTLIGDFFLPRIALLSEKYRLHFQLCGLEYFIKTRKRFPKA